MVMKAKTLLQFAACVLLLLNAGCDADYPLPVFINKDKAESARHEYNAVEDLELWTMPWKTDESVMAITERKLQHEGSSKSEINDDTGRLNLPVSSALQERNRNRFARQPTQEELRDSLERINKVISKINKLLGTQQ